MNGIFDITEFGAAGDGKTDSTEAIQAALDAAEKVEGTVIIPPGVFLTGEIVIGTGVTLRGYTGFEYMRPKGSRLKMRRDDTSAGLINLSKTTGCELCGFCVEGLGRDPFERIIHGLFVDKPTHFEQGGQNIFIDRLRVEGFSGCAAYMQNAGVVTIRHSVMAGSGWDGVRAHIWDGWMLDNWFSGNGGAGYRSIESTASITMTGNRIEWNGLGGIVMENAYRYNINGNYIDHSGACGMQIYKSNTLSVTGNLIWRSGKPYEDTPIEDKYSLSQARFRDIRGMTFTGNTLHAGLEDGDGGVFTPDYGLVLEKLQCCAVTGNSLWGCAMKEGIVDLGGHDDLTVVKDNPCSIASGKLD